MPTPSLHLSDAVCRVIFVFDVGREIDLAACRRLAPDLVREAPGRARSPSFSVTPAPLRLELDGSPIVVDGRAVTAKADVGVYEFGAVAVTFLSALDGTLEDARSASCALAGSARLATEARRLVDALLRRIGEAVDDVAVSDVVEDYVVVAAKSWTSEVAVSALAAEFASEFAGILRAESGPLAEEEVTHATETRVSHTPDDVVLLDWNAAIVLHPDPAPVLAVLELVNVQLLEMRFLDRRLDESLQRTYDYLARRGTWRSVRLPRPLREAMLLTGMRQVDATLLYERVSNALKLVGDEYLARVYRRAAARFGLQTWHTAIEQKLRTIGDIYERIHDRVMTTRLEALEWIVILLIATEIALSFLR